MGDRVPGEREAEPLDRRACVCDEDGGVRDADSERSNIVMCCRDPS